jgi:hypothetical protein
LHTTKTSKPHFLKEVAKLAEYFPTPPCIGGYSVVTIMIRNGSLLVKITSFYNN